MRQLIVWPGISRRLGACGLTRDGVLALLNGLRTDLESHYTIYRVLRDEQEPRFFRYLVALADGGLMHEFDFVVDDSISPDHLFIDDFEHETDRL